MTTIALPVALAILQALVALSLPHGRFVWGGEHRALPRRPRLGSAASVLVYAGIAVVLLARGGIIPGEHSTLVIVPTWVAFALFALSVPLNALSRSITERWTMTPTSVALAASTLIIAVGL